MITRTELLQRPPQRRITWTRGDYLAYGEKAIDKALTHARAAGATTCRWAGDLVLYKNPLWGMVSINGERAFAPADVMRELCERYKREGGYKVTCTHAYGRYWLLTFDLKGGY